MRILYQHLDLVFCFVFCLLFWILLTVIDGDQSKATIKDEENSSVKLEEKSCSNPLAGLANAINSITNGVNNEDSTAIPVSVPINANSKHVPPKAMVKPQVLTHVIEGFVIQEGITLIFYIHIFQLFYIYTYIQYIIYFSV